MPKLIEKLTRARRAATFPGGGAAAALPWFVPAAARGAEGQGPPRSGSRWA